MQHASQAYFVSKELFYGLSVMVVRYYYVSTLMLTVREGVLQLK